MLRSFDLFASRITAVVGKRTRRKGVSACVLVCVCVCLCPINEQNSNQINQYMWHYFIVAIDSSLNLPLHNQLG